MDKRIHPDQLPIESELKQAIREAFHEMYDIQPARKFMWISLDRWKEIGAALTVLTIVIGAITAYSSKPSEENVKTIVVETLDQRRTDRNKEIEKLIDLKNAPMYRSLEDIKATLQEIKSDVRSLNHK